MSFIRVGVALVLAIAAFSTAAGRTLPQLLPSHPGNIFLAGESVVVPEPPGAGEDWRAVNYEGKTIATGTFTHGKAELGVLPVGWYKVVRSPGHLTNRVYAAVLAPLRAPTPLTSPIGIDVAMAWIYPDARMSGVISICQLAGMNRVRDRMSWPEMEPQRGQFAPHNRYDDSLKAQTDAGLRMLEVNHVSAPWANSNSMRFPRDLRDIYNTYKELARRWRGNLEAFEPWNEADIMEFGGHMGSEMATMQKAAWFGLKAGNPDLTVCQNVFAIHRAATLRDFQENEAWPYFDTFNLHHYDQFKGYAKMWEQFRGVSGGKPMWVSECNVNIYLRDPAAAEPTEADLREESTRIPKIYSIDIAEGARAVYYFMLPSYVEHTVAYGVLRPDLTPRPPFLAVAAAGRLLADAQPLGRVAESSNGLQGYVFKAKPDGIATDVMVVWSEKETTLTLPKPPLAIFDHLGRSVAVSGNSLQITGAPQYVELAKGGRPALVPSPQPAKLLKGTPSPVVLQAALPEADIVFKDSACHLPAGPDLTVPVCIYNFGARTATGKLKVEVPAQWTARPLDDVEIKPGERRELSLYLTHPETSGLADATVRITGHFKHGGGNPVLSFRLTTSKP